MGYLALAGVVFGANLLPAFGPPTWAILVYFRLESDLAAITGRDASRQPDGPAHGPSAPGARGPQSAAWPVLRRPGTSASSARARAPRAPSFVLLSGWRTPDGSPRRAAGQVSLAGPRGECRAREANKHPGISTWL